MALEENLFTTKVDLFALCETFLGHFPGDPGFKIADQAQFGAFLEDFSARRFLRSERPLLSLKRHCELVGADKGDLTSLAPHLPVPRDPAQATQLPSHPRAGRVPPRAAGALHYFPRGKLRARGGLPALPRLAHPQLTRRTGLGLPAAARLRGGALPAVHRQGARPVQRGLLHQVRALDHFLQAPRHARLPLAQRGPPPPAPALENRPGVLGPAQRPQVLFLRVRAADAAALVRARQGPHIQARPEHALRGLHAQSARARLR